MLLSSLAALRRHLPWWNLVVWRRGLRPDQSFQDPATMTETESKRRKFLSTSLPIDILPTDTARLYTHMHPFLVLGVYYLRFNALVADPVSTLLTSLLPLSVLQISSAVTCLPAAKRAAKQSTPVKSAKQGQRKKPGASKAENGLSNKLVVCIQYTGVPIRVNVSHLSLGRCPGPPARSHPRRTLPHDPPHPLRRAIDDAFPSHVPLRRPYVTSCDLAPRVYTWCRGS